MFHGGKIEFGEVQFSCLDPVNTARNISGLRLEEKRNLFRAGGTGLGRMAHSVHTMLNVNIPGEKVVSLIPGIISKN